MSEPIKVGDLVMVVRGHSCAIELIGGVPFTVESIEPQIGGSWCNRCGERNIAPESLYGATGVPKPRVKVMKAKFPKGAMPLEWLKKIPPIGELDDVKRDEEITA